MAGPLPPVASTPKADASIRKQPPDNQETPRQHVFPHKESATPVSYTHLGIRQFCEILAGWGLEGSEVPLEEVLHLKTGVNYIEDNNMLVSGEFIDKPDFAKYNKVVVPEDEAYGANCIWVNGTVIVAEGYPTVLKAVQDLGYKTLVVDTSEYRKIDGGLSCLSLRF